MLYALAAVLALFGSGAFSCGVLLVFSLAVSGIAETMHGMETHTDPLFWTLILVAAFCLVAFIVTLVAYIKRCMKEKSLKKILLSVLLFLVLLPVFVWFILNVIWL